MIRLLAGALLLVALLIAAVADFGYSADEEAYLDEVREQSALVDIAEGYELRQGYAICVALAEIKPGEDREQMARHLLLDEGYTYGQITAATGHLCPDIRLDPEFTSPMRKNQNYAVPVILEQYDPYDLLDGEASRVERFYAGLTDADWAGPRPGAWHGTARPACASLHGRGIHPCRLDGAIREFVEQAGPGVGIERLNDVLVERMRTPRADGHARAGWSS